jgi:hypothetical protein
VVGEGVVERVDSGSVATGTMAVVDSSGVVVALAVALVALVTADSAVPELIDEMPEADEPLEPVDKASEADEPVELIEEASESDDAVFVAEASPVAEDCTAEVASPEPPAVVSVLLGLVAIGTIGMMVLSLDVVAGSLELPEAMVVGLSVG